MRAYVVTEGPTDVALLEGALPEDLREHVQVMSAGGRNSVSSMAASLLSYRGKPVAAVLDADAVSEDLNARRKAEVEAVMGLTGGGVPRVVLLAVPTIEALLFEAGVVEDALDVELSPVQRELATYDPKRVLTELGAPNGPGLLQRLEPRHWARVRETGLLRRLISFLLAAPNGKVPDGSPAGAGERDLVVGAAAG
jgi:hypothetical protein